MWKRFDVSVYCVGDEDWNRRTGCQSEFCRRIVHFACNNRVCIGSVSICKFFSYSMYGYFFVCLSLLLFSVKVFSIPNHRPAACCPVSEVGCLYATQHSGKTKDEHQVKRIYIYIFSKKKLNWMGIKSIYRCVLKSLRIVKLCAV